MCCGRLGLRRDTMATVMVITRKEVPKAEDESSSDEDDHHPHHLTPHAEHGAGATMPANITQELTKSMSDIQAVAARQLNMGVSAVMVAGKLVSTQAELTSAVDSWKADMQERENKMLHRHLTNQYDRVLAAMDAGDLDSQMTAARIAWELATRSDFHDLFTVRFAQVPPFMLHLAHRVLAS